MDWFSTKKAGRHATGLRWYVIEDDVGQDGCGRTAARKR